MFLSSQFEDVFMYADIERVELTEIDTVRATVTVRGTGASLTVEDDDIDLVANELLRRIDKQVWLVNDICRDYDVTLDELRELVMSEFEQTTGFSQTYGFSDGYAAGYEDGKRYSTNEFDWDVNQMLDYAESNAFDEGYLAGLNDGLDSEYMASTAEPFDEHDLFTSSFDEFPEEWDRPLDAPVEYADNLIPMNKTVALAAQPFLARDPETDDLYITYKLDR